MKPAHKFPYKWRLANGYPAAGIEQHGAKVFGTFICGGGSTMGYKLAGYEHLGGVEIDAPIAAVYQANHHPKHLFHEDIRLFLERDDLPDELYHLDLLDGSPPCSSFSMAGNREKDWNKNKVFREGQADQKLDDLFFTYIALAKKLQPKVVLAENVKGMLQGNAKFYVSRIKKEFEAAGYKVQLFCFNAASMGVPQKRERAFFICLRNDIKLPELQLGFDEPSIPYKEVEESAATGAAINKDSKTYALWAKCGPGENFSKYDAKGQMFGYAKVSPLQTPNTVVCSSGTAQYHHEHFRQLTPLELCKIGSYPLDYDFQGIRPKYLIGMSVPPVMTAQVAHQIYLQWLSKLPS